jgi:uncharacterized protein YbjT (DUF2867 family)
MVVGDVRTGEALADAAYAMDTIVHAATSSARRARETEVRGTARMADLAGGAGAHLVYVSIVGVDRHRFPYYKAKWAAEQQVTASRARWTILRATQFHELLDTLLGGPAFIRTPNLAFQVVDAGEVAARVVELVETGPAGRVPDFGGPEVVPIQHLAESRERITGRRARLVPVPRIGFIRDFDDGRHLCPDYRSGQITWEQWLALTR